MTVVSVESLLCLVGLLAGGPRCQDSLDPDRHQAASMAATPEVSKKLAFDGAELAGCLEDRMLQHQSARTMQQWWLDTSCMW